MSFLVDKQLVPANSRGHYGRGDRFLRPRSTPGRGRVGAEPQVARIETPLATLEMRGEGVADQLVDATIKVGAVCAFAITAAHMIKTLRSV